MFFSVIGACLIVVILIGVGTGYAAGYSQRRRKAYKAPPQADNQPVYGNHCRKCKLWFNVGIASIPSIKYRKQSPDFPEYLVFECSRCGYGWTGSVANPDIWPPIRKPQKENP